MSTEKERHLSHLTVLGLVLKSEDDNNYCCVWKNTDIPLWVRKDSLDDFMKVATYLAEEDKKLEYKRWYGKYDKDNNRNR
jgi:hypothetical protein